MYQLTTRVVTCDDYGDTRWNYYYELRRGERLLWTDYTVTEPTLPDVLRELREYLLS